MVRILPQSLALTAPLAGACLVTAAVLTLCGPGARAQQAGYGQTISGPQQERELDYGTGGARSNNVLDATNPMDLMNRIRRATALDDATAPDDAVDAALRDFHSQTASPGSSQVKAP